MSRTEIHTAIVPLGRTAHDLAQNFARQQASTEKGKQVYLNTLAVYAVHSYLQLLDIETDLEQGNCWNPFVRTCRDVSDLVLPGLGRIDCRPVLPRGESFTPSDEPETDLLRFNLKKN
jgi:hypothetical protein